jgi:hypothetical protein
MVWSTVTAPALGVATGTLDVELDLMLDEELDLMLEELDLMLDNTLEVVGGWDELELESLMLETLEILALEVVVTLAVVVVLAVVVTGFTQFICKNVHAGEEGPAPMMGD